MFQISTFATVTTLGVSAYLRCTRKNWFIVVGLLFPLLISTVGPFVANFVSAISPIDSLATKYHFFLFRYLCQQ